MDLASRVLEIFWEGEYSELDGKHLGIAQSELNKVQKAKEEEARKEKSKNNIANLKYRAAKNSGKTDVQKPEPETKAQEISKLSTEFADQSNREIPAHIKTRDPSDQRDYYRYRQGVREALLVLKQFFL